MPRFTLAALRFRPATPARWPDVEELFGERGACAGCWCMFWRLPRKEWESAKGARNRASFESLVRDGSRPGILAYFDGRPMGWCALAPRREYGHLSRSRIMAPVDDRPVWSISCLFVARPYRRRGVSVRLLRAAADHAARRGARIVEGYPSEPGAGKTADAFLWLGTADAFRRAGFHEVMRRSPTRPIMRRSLRARRASS